METWSWNTTRKEPSLEAPIRKTERAHEHMANLSAKIDAFLASCDYKVRRDFQGDPPSFVVTVEEVHFPPVPYEFSILAGEAVHHLRSSLDYLIFELVRANKSEPSRKNMWPIGGLVKEGIPKAKVAGVSPTALKLIESFQPYRLGTRYKEHPLWRLNKLDNWDKHRFLIRTFLAQPGGIVAEWIDSSGRLVRDSQSTTVEIEPGHKFSWGPARGIRPEMNVKIKSEPKVVFEDITGLENKAVIPVLLELSGEVLSIVQKFSSALSGKCL